MFPPYCISGARGDCCCCFSETADIRRGEDVVCCRRQDDDESDAGAKAIQTTWMKTTLSLEWRVDFVRGKSSLSRNLSRNYLNLRRSVVITSFPLVRHPKKNQSLPLTPNTKRRRQKKIPSSAPHCLALVSLLEFDGRRWYHQKERRLALLLVPHFCPYDRCGRNYSHFPVVKLGGNRGCQQG